MGSIMAIATGITSAFLALTVTVDAGGAHAIADGSAHLDMGASRRQVCWPEDGSSFVAFALTREPAAYPRILIFTTSLSVTAILAPIIELGGAGGGMHGHLARLLERAAVLEVGGDPGAAESVIAHFGVT